MTSPTIPSRALRYRFSLLLTIAVGLAGCAHVAEVSPAEVPSLAARAAKEPANAALLSRFAQALFAAQQCDSAQGVARRALALQSDDAVAVLVIGQCDERANRHTAAIALYRQFLANHGEGSGGSAVRARELLAVREDALNGARAALQREQQLAQEPGDPQTLAVLPLDIQGDSSYQPLSRGLAQILTSDLALLRRFKMVERLQLSALLDEMHFGHTARVDQTTAARVGHLMRAGRMVQGTATIRSEQSLRLEATVIRATGEVTNPQVANGRLADLLKMEKDIVVGLAAQLGYQLSEAERQAILENGTQSLAAFLSYSKGLIAEDLGDFSRAAAYYGQAVQSDPGFQQAKSQYQANSAAPVMQAGGSVASSVTQANAAGGPSTTTPEPTAAAVNSSVGDLASTHSEQSSGSSQQVTQQASSTTASTPPPVSITPPATVTGTIRIVFRLP